MSDPNEVEIKPIPSWLKTVTPEGAWVTLAPFIFHPEGIQPEANPAIIAHELTHIKQQTDSGSVIRWVDRYFSDKDFRLRMEIEAIRAELKHIPEKDLAARIYGWGNMLAYSGPYMQAADTPEQVVDLLKDLYPGILPPPGMNAMTQEQFTAMVNWQTHGVTLKDPTPQYGVVDVDWDWGRRATRVQTFNPSPRVVTSDPFWRDPLAPSLDTDFRDW